MKNVEDVYSLSPMQEFMLLHSVARRNADVLFDQFCFEIEQDLDVDAFRDAWQALLERHSILRTAFVWEKVKSPLQIVRATLEIPFDLLDWSDATVEEQQRRFEALRTADRGRGFNLSKAPLLRVQLVRLAAARYYLLWSSHHLLMDRWCLDTVLAELSHFYAALVHGSQATLATCRPYRDYIEWIGKQDAIQAERFWRTQLDDLSAPTCTSRPCPSRSSTGPNSASLALAEDCLAAARNFARQNGLTFSALIQGAWFLALNRILGAQDLVVGIAGAGRPPDLPGVEGILGCFINNLPFRARLSASQGQLAFLQTLQAAQLAQRRCDYVSALALVEWSDMAASGSLFDHLIVWLSPDADESKYSIQMRGLPGELTTAYPLTLSVAEGSQSLRFTLRVSATHEAVAPLEDMLAALSQVLIALIDGDRDRPLREMPGFVGMADFEPTLESSQPVSTGAHADAPGDQQLARSGRAASELAMLEDILEAHWAEALLQPTIDRDASIFDLGATSLSAAAVHLRIETSTRQRVPILALYREPSIKGMARTLIEGDWPLKPGWCFSLRKGDTPPLFCIASPDVDTLGFVLLTRHLDPGRAVHLLQAPPDSDQVRRLTPYELPRLSERYTATLRAVQSTGPYHILGMCTGAQLAMEIARQLEFDHERVPFVGIIHTWGYYTVSRWRALAVVINRARYYYRRIRQLMDDSGARSFMRSRRDFQATRISTRTAGAPSLDTSTMACNPDIAAIPDQQEPALDDAEVTRQWLEEFGRPEKDPLRPKFKGTVTLFRNAPRPWWSGVMDEQLWRVRDPLMGWRRQAEQVTLEMLSGDDHDAILREPNVRELAVRVQSHIFGHDQ